MTTHKIEIRGIIGNLFLAGPNETIGTEELVITLIHAGYDVVVNGHPVRLYYGPGWDAVQFSDTDEFLIPRDQAYYT